ncbi:hypothetical protein D3C80_836090 [compost metagenome]
MYWNFYRRHPTPQSPECSRFIFYAELYIASQLIECGINFLTVRTNFIQWPVCHFTIVQQTQHFRFFVMVILGTAFEIFTKDRNHRTDSQRDSSRVDIFMFEIGLVFLVITRLRCDDTFDLNWDKQVTHCRQPTSHAIHRHVRIHLTNIMSQ